MTSADLVGMLPWVGSIGAEYGLLGQDQEDFVQDVAVKALGALHRFEEKAEGSAYAWLRTIACNRAAQVVKKRRNWTSRAAPLTAFPREGDVFPAPGFEDPEEAILERLAAQERALAIRATLRSLEEAA